MLAVAAVAVPSIARVVIGSRDGSPCAVSASTFIDPGAFPELERFVEQTSTKAPVKGGAGKPQQRPAVAEFRGGRMVGSIARIAVDGPDRAAQDGEARAKGYPIGRWPLVPLHGAVVEHARGLLEVYEFHAAYLSSKGVADWVAFLAASHADSGARLEVPGGDADISAWRYYIGDNDGSNELVVEAVISLGSATVRLDLQGSPGMDIAALWPVVFATKQRVLAACGPQIESGGSK